ncbi:De-etiolated protein 1 Det1-domain-containing protein [Cladochytrium replicatum]|nr:De-etiolated protein 1 Det1-domain-containing protein [Cladochytrium replicatum]
MNSHNIVTYLRQRESVQRKPNTSIILARRNYEHLFPTSTIYDLVAPTDFRKFTPDGKLLISFSQNQHAIQAYRFNGPGVDPSWNRTNIFQCMFSLMYETILAGGTAQLSRDFCLFTSDKKYVILASACPTSSPPTAAARYPHSLNGIPNLDDICLWVVEINTGVICDNYALQSDYVFLTNHAGVHLYKNFLGIASVQHQSIYILQITESGTFLPIRTIGWDTNEDDSLLIDLVEKEEENFQLRKRRRVDLGQNEQSGISFVPAPSTDENLDLDGDPMIPSDTYQLTQTSGSRNPPMHMVPTVEPAAIANTLSLPGDLDGEDDQRLVSSNRHGASMIGGLKHRIMAYLFRKSSCSGNSRQMQRYFETFQQFASLVMWRMQFLDEHHFLIKFGYLENVLGWNVEPSISQSAFFVIYSLLRGQVIAVYENNSEELLEAYESWDIFRGAPYPTDSTHFVSMPSNNEFARHANRKNMHAVRKARNGGAVSAVKRVLSALPFNPQSYIDSPYFDLSLYSFDEKIINSCDRQRVASEAPVKFYSRRNGTMKFRIDPHPPPSHPLFQGDRHLRRYVTYIFHPTDPFVITVLVVPNRPSIVNFHFRR